MIPLTLIPFSVVSLLAVLFLLYIFATLSRRLGEVTKMKPYYRWFYVAMALVVVAIIAAALRPPNDPHDLTGYVLAYDLPLILAGIISLIVAYRYWGWLFRERSQ
jgi:hypothetical protein